EVIGEFVTATGTGNLVPPSKIVLNGRIAPPTEQTPDGPRRWKTPPEGLATCAWRSGPRPPSDERPAGLTRPGLPVRQCVRRRGVRSGATRRLDDAQPYELRIEPCLWHDGRFGTCASRSPRSCSPACTHAHGCSASSSRSQPRSQCHGGCCPAG